MYILYPAEEPRGTVHHVVRSAERTPVRKHALKDAPSVLSLAGMDGEKLRLELHAHRVNAVDTYLARAETRVQNRNEFRLVLRIGVEEHFAQRHAARAQIKRRILNLKFIEIARGGDADVHTSPCCGSAPVRFGSVRTQSSAHKTYAGIVARRAGARQTNKREMSQTSLAKQG